jgi:hypothetical protein
VKVSTLPYDTSLTIQKGSEVIVWMKKHDGPTFKIRRMHFKDKKLQRISDSKKLGTAEDEELSIRLTSGFKLI